MKDKNPIITKLLVEAYAAELETVQNYLANSVWLDGLRAEEIKESLEEDVTEELGHAKKLVQRLKQLGARPPGSLHLTRSQRSLQPPQDSTDLLSVINGVLEAENQAIDKYNEIIRVCDGKDYVTQDLAIKILADEEEHRTLFEGFLKTVSARAEAAAKPSRAEIRQMRTRGRGERQRF